MKDLLIWGSFLSFSITAAIFSYQFLSEGLDEALNLFTTDHNRFSNEPVSEFRASLLLLLILVLVQWKMFREITIFPWSKRSQEGETEN